jgi:glycosyltransferase involved in cell wall biosynthesis
MQIGLLLVLVVRSVWDAYRHRSPEYIHPTSTHTTECIQLAPITVLIPLYNKGAWIERALSSVQAQTFPTIDILVVDDCSGDGGPAIVEAQRRSDRRIRLISLGLNCGSSLARMIGVMSAVGRWILSLDADDELYDSIVETLFTHPLLENHDILMFPMMAFSDSVLYPLPRLFPRKILMTHDDLVGDFVRQCLCWSLSAKFIRSSLYRQALSLLNQTVQKRHITFAEDKLQFGLICLKTRSMLFLPWCTGYLSYISTPGNTVEQIGAASPMRAALQAQELSVNAVLRYICSQLNISIKF